MTETKCLFCHGGKSIESRGVDIVWYLDPKNDYARVSREQAHVNVQVDMYDDASAQFWFNYCPMCGRKVGE